MRVYQSVLVRCCRIWGLLGWETVQCCGRMPTLKWSFHPEDGSSMGPWKVGILPQHYTTSQQKDLYFEHHRREGLKTHISRWTIPLMNELSYEVAHLWFWAWPQWNILLAQGKPNLNKFRALNNVTATDMYTANHVTLGRRISLSEVLTTSQSHSSVFLCATNRPLKAPVFNSNFRGNPERDVQGV